MLGCFCLSVAGGFQDTVQTRGRWFPALVNHTKELFPPHWAVNRLWGHFSFSKDEQAWTGASNAMSPSLLETENVNFGKSRAWSWENSFDRSPGRNLIPCPSQSDRKKLARVWGQVNLVHRHWRQWEGETVCSVSSLLLLMERHLFWTLRPNSVGASWGGDD